MSKKKPAKGGKKSPKKKKNTNKGNLKLVSSKKRPKPGVRNNFAKDAFDAPFDEPDNVKELFAEIQAPEGFRPVTLLQASILYCEPMLERLGDADEEILTEGQMLALDIWHYASEAPMMNDEEKTNADNELTTEISEIFSIPLKDAQALLLEMIERKAHYFPPEMAPPPTLDEDSPFDVIMMRKDEPIAIERVPLTSELFSGAVLPDPEQDAFFSTLDYDGGRMSELSGDEAAEFLDHQIDNFLDAFYQWLEQRTLPFSSEMVIAFASSFFQIALESDAGDPELALPSIGAAILPLPGVVDEFLLDYLPGFLALTPEEMTVAPPALRLYFRFCLENYLIDRFSAANLQREVDSAEDMLIRMLERHYGE